MERNVPKMSFAAARLFTRIKQVHQTSARSKRGTQKRQKNVPFWVLDGFTKTSGKFFGRNGGDDEARTAAVTGSVVM
jgi:hypothetical protein